MSKISITIIKGAQGSGKTTKAKELIGEQEFEECGNAAELSKVLTFSEKSLKFILMDESTYIEASEAIEVYENFMFAHAKPKLIICIQDNSLAANGVFVQDLA